MEDKSFNWKGLAIAAAVTIAILGGVVLSFGSTPSAPARAAAQAQSASR